MKREQNLQELLTSTSLSAVTSIILCLLLPGITTKGDMAAFFLMFWFIGIYCIWSLIDWKGGAKRPHQLGGLKRRKE